MEYRPALRKPVFVDTRKVEPGTRINIHARIESVNITSQRKRFDGSLLRYADCVAGDQYGCFHFFVKNE